MISYRQASFQSIFSQVDAMTDQQRDEFFSKHVREHGIEQTMGMVKNTLVNIARSQRQAQVSDSGMSRVHDQGYKELNTPVEERPSKLKHALNVTGNWGYLLTFLILLGMAGTAGSNIDKGGDWSDIIRSFALTLGSGFLSWATKKLASYVK